MAAEFIIDIEGIDLSATAADADAIARLNPHRGEIVQIDRVVWHDEAFDHAIAARHIREDEFWVEGHVPGNPLLPGVLMVEGAAQLASWMYYRRTPTDVFAGFTRIEDTTFRSQVRPGDTMHILCKSLKYSPRRFVCRCQGVKDGSLVFDSTITGMAFPKVGSVQRVEPNSGTGRPLVGR